MRVVRVVRVVTAVTVVKVVKIVKVDTRESKISDEKTFMIEKIYFFFFGFGCQNLRMNLFV